jgi:hypothetical protein
MLTMFINRQKIYLDTLNSISVLWYNDSSNRLYVTSDVSVHDWGENFLSMIYEPCCIYIIQPVDNIRCLPMEVVGGHKVYAIAYTSTGSIAVERFGNKEQRS